MIPNKIVSVVMTFVSLVVIVLWSIGVFSKSNSANAAVKYTDEDIWCLAKNIFHEAGVESDLGKYAVAQVTLNRVEKGRWPSSICDVVMDPSQFSWTLNKRLVNMQPKGKNWERSLEIAYDVLENGIVIKALENALFYHATYVNPYWAKHKQKITQIDRHIFYTYRD